MSGWFQNLLKDAAGGFFGSEYLRDYTHADKAFHSNLYQYAPKFKYLFHCYFNINQSVYDIDKNASTQQNFGILVRDVKLPSYQMQVQQMNQYNRKRLVQTKIKYQPVSFTFFDDNSNTMAKLWAAYYTYYYYDGSNPDVLFGGKPGAKGQDLGSAIQAGTVRGLGGRSGAGGADSSQYFERNLYNPSITGNTNWGYVSESSQPKKQPFFKDITVYGFYQKNFIAYTLINPVITEFAHDTYSYDEGTGIMKNTMSIDYETVVYNEGNLAGNNPGQLVPGFADVNTYDRKLSPIAMPGSNNTVLGQGGLVDAVNGAVNSFTGKNKNILAGIKTIGAAYKTFKNTNLVQTLKNDLKTSFLNNLRQQPNQTRNLNFSFENPASGPGAANNASAPTTGAVGGTSATQTTDKTKGTSFQIRNGSNPTNIVGTNTTSGLPNETTAGKQSNTGGGVELPPLLG